MKRDERLESHTGLTEGEGDSVVFVWPPPGYHLPKNYPETTKKTLIS